MRQPEGSKQSNAEPVASEFPSNKNATENDKGSERSTATVVVKDGYKRCQAEGRASGDAPDHSAPAS